MLNNNNLTGVISIINVYDFTHVKSPLFSLYRES
nr:MAG TPA: hypothetical protein [Siphoviridae sp. ctngg6]